MLLCDIVYKFLDEDGLSHTSTSEKTDLSTFKVRFKEINDFDSGKKYFLRCRQIFKLWRFSVNRKSPFSGEVIHSVYRISNDIHDSTTDLWTYRHCYRRTSSYCFQSSSQSISTIHGDGSDSIFAYMLLNFDYKHTSVGTMNLKGFMNGWKSRLVTGAGLKMDINHRADYLRNISFKS